MQFTAVLGGGARRNFEIPGIGHHDPIPLGATTGQLFYSSGIDGRDPATGALVPGAERQADQALDNQAALLEIAGGSPANVGHVTALIADVSYEAVVKEALQRHFPEPADRPALHTMLLGVKGRDTLVQLHAIGVV
jgi:2-iminobutanoate/2-iminopropanoate deaminase